MKTDRQQLFESASIPKVYFTLTIPSVLGKIIMLLYNMADTWFIAATGDTNLVAGVALCGPAFTLMLVIGDMFGMGSSSVISRLFGSQLVRLLGYLHRNPTGLVPGPGLLRHLGAALLKQRLQTA